MEPMEGRWVCRRCFASNDPGATTCVQCGLERGADPASAAPATDPVTGRPLSVEPQWMPAPPPERPTWLTLVQRFWFIGLIVIVAAVGWYLSARRDDSGQIANSGNMEVQELRVGDCFDLQDEAAAEISEVEAKPCTQAHKYELIHAATMPESEYPSDDAFDAFSEAECIPAFNAYTGIDWNASVLQMLPLTPTEEA